MYLDVSGDLAQYDRWWCRSARSLVSEPTPVIHDTRGETP